MWLPRADYAIVNMGMHATVRDGTRGCLRAFARDIPWLTSLTGNATSVCARARTRALDGRTHARARAAAAAACG